MDLDFELCTTEELCKGAGGTEKLLIELRDKLQEWLKLQPHLPQDVSERKLEWIILGTKMSLEVAKQKLDMYYTIRRLVPELFTNRDPRAASLASLRNSMQWVMLPRLSPEKHKIFIFRALVNEPSKFEPWEFYKYTFMMGDIQMDECQNAGEIYVYDLSMVSLGHLMKLSPAILKKTEIAASRAYAVRIKGIHFINAPSFVDRIVSMIKSVAKPKLAARVHVHTADNLESLYEFVPKSTLPKDYGGGEQSMDEIAAYWNERIDSWRDWFIAQEKVLVDESLRPGPSIDGDTLFGFSGSFRKLDVD